MPIKYNQFEGSGDLLVILGLYGDNSLGMSFLKNHQDWFPSIAFHHFNQDQIPKEINEDNVEHLFDSINPKVLMELRDIKSIDSLINFLIKAKNELNSLSNENLVKEENKPNE